MAAAGESIPITVYKVIGQGAQTPEIRRLPEDDAETFLTGTPVQLSSGVIIEQPTINGAHLVAGIAAEPASNLSVDATPKHLTYGSVQNQSSAVLIPVGAPPNDGKIGVIVANGSTIFKAKTLYTHALALSDVGTIYGLTEDTNHFWYIDTSVTAAGSGAVCEVVELIDDVGDYGGLVAFKFTQAARQLER